MKLPRAVLRLQELADLADVKGREEWEAALLKAWRARNVVCELQLYEDTTAAIEEAAARYRVNLERNCTAELKRLHEEQREAEHQAVLGTMSRAEDNISTLAKHVRRPR